MIRQVLERVFVILDERKDEIETPREPQIKLTVDPVIARVPGPVTHAYVADVIQTKSCPCSEALGERWSLLTSTATGSGQSGSSRRQETLIVRKIIAPCDIAPRIFITFTGTTFGRAEILLSLVTATPKSRAMSFQRPPRRPRDPLNRAHYLPRLPREYYQGDAMVFWTLTVSGRAQGWLTQSLHSRFRELMLHTAAREGLICPAYCLMPDHIHLVWMGLRLDTDQLNGMAFLRTYLEPGLAPAKFQMQAQDEVLRESQRARDALSKVCFYVAANPVRAGLVTQPEEWPFSGSVVPGYPKLNLASTEGWARFWRIYTELREPDAGQLVRPPIGTGG